MHFRIAYHLLFWGLVWAFYAFFFSYNATDIRLGLLLATLLLPLSGAATYLTLYRLVPLFLEKKHFLQFGMYSAALLLSAAVYILTLLLGIIGFLPQAQYENLPPLGQNFAYLMVLVYLVVAVAGFASIWRKNANTLQQNLVLQQQLLEAEVAAKVQALDTLKNQLHPHFLFNTLNTLYGMALRQSAATPDLILKLSALLDYTLYQTDKPVVPLIAEVEHLQQYLELERTRFADSLVLEFSQAVAIQDLKVPPMLLLPFVENAFKHGGTYEGKTHIRMYLEANEAALTFTVSNTYQEHEGSGGLGLANVRDRLNLLYPDRHDLAINQDDHWHHISLVIQHSKHPSHAPA